MRILVSIILILTTLTATAEDKTGDLWWAYLAEYKSGPGSTVLNLTINSRAPIKQYRYLLEVGVEFEDKRTNGFPTKKAFKLLYKISDHRHKLILKLIKPIRVGTFTYKGVRSDYYYIQKKGGIEKALVKFYKRYYPRIKYHTSVKSDPQWAEYKKFLFPGKSLVKYYKKELVKHGYLKADGTVVDDQIKQFWSWFERSNLKLHQLVTSNKPKTLSVIVTRQLYKISKGLTYEIGGKEFTISASGERKYFSLVQRIVTAAPKLKGWTITAFRQRSKKINDLEIKFSDVSLSAKDIWFKLASKNYRVSINLCIKGYKQKSGVAFKSLTAQSKLYIKAAYILLDAALGEYDATVNVARISFCPLPARPGKIGLKPLVKLAVSFDRLRNKISEIRNQGMKLKI